MGVNYSKMECVDQTNKCGQIVPIPYTVYSKNVKEKTTAQIKQYVCGSKIGEINECCDPFDPASSDIVKDTNLIKVFRDNDEKYTKFHVCQCDLNDRNCIDQYCRGFKQPTQYEKCKSRNLPNHQSTQINKQVYEVKITDAFPNCYQLCGGGFAPP